MSAAAEAVVRFAELHPLAVRLAERVSFAVIVDRALLRTARLELVPDADAGAEADVWFSSLVQSRTADGVVFEPSVAEELRRRMSPADVEQAWALTLREHKRWMSPSLRIEEEIAYLNVSKQPTAKEELAERLQSVILAMVAGDRPALAHWATRALAMFPSDVRALPEVQMLDSGTRLRLGQPMAKRDGPLPSWMPFVAPQSAERVPLTIDLREEELEIRADPTPPPGATVIEVPSTKPLLLEVSWEAGGGRTARQITLRSGEAVTLAVGRGELRLRSINGDQYDLREEGTTPAALAPYIVDFSDVLRRNGVFLGRENVLREVTGARGVVVVVGALGMGKTALLVEVLRSLQNDVPTFAHFFCAGDFRRQSIETAERSIGAQIVARYNLSPTLLEMRLGHLLQQLALRVDHPERLVILMDDIDEALDARYERPENPIQEMFPSLPAFVTVVATSTLEVVADGFTRIDLRRDSRAIAQFFQYAFRASLHRVMGEEITVDAVVQAADGNFAIVEFIGAAASWLKFGSLNAIIRQLLPSRAEDREAVGILAVARGPLAREEVLGRSALISAPYAFVRSAAQGEISLVNDFFKAAVFSFGEGLDPKKSHRLLVERLRSSLETPSVAAYYYLHAPAHLLAAEDKAEARDLCLDIAFMTEKVRRYGVAPLAADLRSFNATLADDKFLYWVREYLEREVALIEESPDDLGAILYARLRAGMEPEEIETGLHIAPLPLVPAEPMQERAALLRRHHMAVTGSAPINVLPPMKIYNLATWSEDGQVILWGAEHGLEPMRLQHAAAVTAFASNGQYAFTGDANGFLYFWNMLNGSLEARFAAHDGAVRGMTLGNTIATWGEDGMLRVWKESGGRFEVAHEMDPVTSARYSPGGEVLVNARGGRLWTGDTPHSYEYAPIKAFEISSNGQWAAVLCEDGMVRTESVTVEEFISASFFTGDSSGMALAPDDRTLATWGDDGSIRLWNLRETAGIVLAPVSTTFTLQHGSAVNTCAFFPNRPWIVSASASGTAIVWDIETGAVVSRFEGHRRAIRTVTVEEERVFTAGDDRVVKVWDAATGREIADYSLPPGRIDACLALEEGVAIFTDGETRVEMADVAPYRQRVEKEIAKPRLARVERTPAVAWSTATSEIVSFDMPDRIINTYGGDGVTACATDAQTRLAATGHADGSIELGPPDETDRRTSRYFGRIFRGLHHGPVSALTFVGSVRALVSGAADGSLAYWPLEERALTSLDDTFANLASFLNTLDAEGEQKLALSHSTFPVIRNAAPVSGTPQWHTQAHRAPILALAATEKHIATGAADGTLRLWDLAGGHQTLHGHASEVTGCLFAAEGTLLVSVSDRAIHVHEVTSGREIAVCRGHKDTITGFDVLNDEIFSCSDDATVRRWDLTTGRQTAIVYGTCPFRCISAGYGNVLAGDNLGNLWLLVSRENAAAMRADEPRADLSGRRCFVSYSRPDAAELARRLTDDLQRQGLDIFMDRSLQPRDEDLDRAIKRAISRSHFFILLLTRRFESLRRMHLELDHAREERKIVIPVLLEDVELPADLRGLAFIDGRGWRDQKSYDDLMEGLTKRLQLRP